MVWGGVGLPRDGESEMINVLEWFKWVDSLGLPGGVNVAMAFSPVFAIPLVIVVVMLLAGRR